jgi:hypothetical protein
MSYVLDKQGENGHLAFPGRESGTYGVVSASAWPIHSPTVSETHGRVRFPWLVRQFTRPNFVAMTDGVP